VNEAATGNRNDITFKHGSTVLQGVVYKPTANTPVPVIVLVPGHGLRSNPIDAHGSFDFVFDLIGHHLIQAGIAVLHYARPGTGGSTGDWRLQTLYDRADEVLAAIRFLREDTDLAPTQLGVLGHSNGGWVAPLVASLSDQVDFMVTLAGPAISIGAQALSAFQMALRQQHVPTADYIQLTGYAQTILTLYRLIMQGKRTEFEALKKRLESEKPPEHDLMPEFSFAIPVWEERAAILSSMDSMIDYDAVATLQRVRCPVLAILGEKDTAFDSLESAALYAHAFQLSGNRNTAIHVLPDANHRLQVRREDGSMGTEPSLQTLVTTWIRRQTTQK
jgi:uncharacterized protein